MALQRRSPRYTDTKTTAPKHNRSSRIKNAAMPKGRRRPDRRFDFSTWLADWLIVIIIVGFVLAIAFNRKWGA